MEGSGDIGLIVVVLHHQQQRCVVEGAGHLGTGDHRLNPRPNRCHPHHATGNHLFLGRAVFRETRWRKRLFRGSTLEACLERSRGGKNKSSAGLHRVRELCKRWSGWEDIFTLPCYVYACTHIPALLWSPAHAREAFVQLENALHLPTAAASLPGVVSTEVRWPRGISLSQFR